MNFIYNFGIHKFPSKHHLHGVISHTPETVQKVPRSESWEKQYFTTYKNDPLSATNVTNSEHTSNEH
jgi:hypothetical protein